MPEETVVDVNENNEIQNEETKDENLDASKMTNEEIQKILSGDKPVEKKEEKTEEELKAEETKKAEEEKKTGGDELKALKEENEKLKKKSEHQEKFLARVSTELGLLRKKNPEEYNKRVQEIRDEFLASDNPAEALKKLKEVIKEDDDLSNAEKEAEFMKTVERNYTVISERIPDFSDKVEEIGKMLIEEDGEDKAFVENFVSNPYFIPPSQLYILYKRVEAKSENQALKKEVETLRAELEAAKKKPDEILKKIENAGKNVVTGGSGGANESTRLSDMATPEQVRRMSKKEIDEYLKKNK